MKKLFLELVEARMPATLPSGQNLILRSVEAKAGVTIEIRLRFFKAEDSSDAERFRDMLAELLDAEVIK